MMQPRKTLGTTSLIFALALSAQGVFAQEPIVRPSRLPVFGRSITSSDDATAIRLNPANLIFAPGSEFRMDGIRLEDDHEVAWQGAAVSLNTRIPFLNWATGFRADFIEPPKGGGGLGRESYQWVTFALASKAGPHSSVGATVQTSVSGGAFANDLTSFSLGYSSRPFNALAFSLVAHDINGPSNGFSTLSRSFDIGAAVRPFGTRVAELGLEGKYLADSETWVPRATVGLDIPGLGRLRGDFSVSDPTSKEARAWVASGGMAFHLNGMGGSGELTGGAISGDGLGGNSNWGAYAGVAARNFRESVGAEPARYALRLRVERTPSARGHAAFLRQLWSISKESNVDAVVLELRASPASSLAHLEELRDAFFELRRAGKRVLCHLEDSNGAALFLCSAATKTLINPAGSVRFSGMRSRALYFSRILANLGIKAEFVRIGAHKSAPEQFTETAPTKTAQNDRIDLLQQFERGLVEGIALGRGLSVSAVRASLKQGPFNAEEAKEHGFADQLAFDDQIGKAVNKATGRTTRLLPDKRRRTTPVTFGRDGYVAIVHIDGEITSGRSRSMPFFGSSSVGSYTIADTLKAVRENKQIKSVVIRVESPGGSSTAADVIWRQVKLTAKAKPTIVSMGAVAASGGYYLAAPATRIFANPLTITGSIGIYYIKADVSKLLSRIGVDFETYKTHESADSDSFFRPFSTDEKAAQQLRIKKFYNLFLKRVADGRNLTIKQVDAVGQGRVWTGEQALKHGLIDELGGLREALAYARERAGLPDDAPTIDLPKIKTSLLSRVLGMRGISTQAQSTILDMPMPDQLTPSLRALAPLFIHDSGEPLARLEFDLQPMP